MISIVPSIDSQFARRLLGWYRQNHRLFPWRRPLNTQGDKGDPYITWVAEIMLQQTQVEAVIPYFHRWIERFPDLASLARADLQEVLLLWEGLGYYRRAHNLHRTAQMIMAEYDGVFPQDVKVLRRLPGIGKYTAGAIASIAFGQDEPAVDGNVRRVFSRFCNLSEPLGTPRAERLFWQVAKVSLPSGRAGDFNQALMDLGATICLPKRPVCSRCPLVRGCEAYRLGIQEQLPLSRMKAAIPHYVVTAAVIQREGKVLIAQRPPGGLLGGLWEFPGGKVEEAESLTDCLRREIFEELAVRVEVDELIGVYLHAYTHFRITLHAFACHLQNGTLPRPREHRTLAWLFPHELTAYPMGKVDRQISRQLLKEYANR